jgi:hypothetical protein
MRFMLIAHGDKNFEAGVPPDPQLMMAIGQLSQEMTKKGVLVSQGGLGPTALGAKLELKNGTVTVKDGPFTEAKEIVGGFAIVDVKSKDEAVQMGREFLELHARILGPSHTMTSEVRRMFVPEDFQH